MILGVLIYVIACIAVHIFIAGCYSIMTIYTKIANILPCIWALGYFLL